jgi:hypothetical protein
VDCISTGESNWLSVIEAVFPIPIKETWQAGQDLQAMDCDFELLSGYNRQRYEPNSKASGQSTTPDDLFGGFFAALGSATELQNATTTIDLRARCRGEQPVVSAVAQL